MKLAIGKTLLPLRLQTCYTPNHVAGFQKHREQSDAPQPRTVLYFNGHPIPRGVVILGVPRFKHALLYTSTKCLRFIVLVLSDSGARARNRRD